MEFFTGPDISGTLGSEVVNTIRTCFQANEVERLVTWYNPLSQSDLLIPGEDDIATWRTRNISEKQYRELARLAWDICPELAVFLPDRFTT